jgi:hypothetical protein
MSKEQFIVNKEELDELGEEGRVLDDVERTKGSFAINYLAENG